MKFKSMRDPEVVTLENDAFDRVYKDLPAHHHVLRKVPICEYCGAIRFPSEGSGFCCWQGKVNIVNTPIPDELRHLFTSQTDRDALYFRKNIRYFNSHFSFTNLELLWIIVSQLPQVTIYYCKLSLHCNYFFIF